MPAGKPDIAKGMGAPATIKLLIHGKEAGSGELPVTIPLSLGLGGGAVLGLDNGSPVMLAEDYEPPFAFTGTVRKDVLDVSEHATDDLEARGRMYLARQ